LVNDQTGYIGCWLNDIGAGPGLTSRQLAILRAGESSKFTGVEGIGGGSQQNIWLHFTVTATIGLKGGANRTGAGVAYLHRQIEWIIVPG
jgi:hypothetical protein